MVGSWPPVQVLQASCLLAIHWTLTSLSAQLQASSLLAIPLPLLRCFKLLPAGLLLESVLSLCSASSFFSAGHPPPSAQVLQASSLLTIPLPLLRCFKLLLFCYLLLESGLSLCSASSFFSLAACWPTAGVCPLSLLSFKLLC